MNIILMIFIVLSVAFLFNEYYFHIVLRNTQEHKILKGLKGKYDRIAFGSTYGLYGISFPKKSNGFNFCMGGQFLYYTDKMLREYAPRCLKPGGMIYLVIADLVFAEVGKGLYHPERYPLILSKQSLGDEYSFFNHLKMRIPLFFNIQSIKQIARYLIKGDDNSFETLTENQLNYEQTLQQAHKRCASWCQQFRLKDTETDVIVSELETTFRKTQEILMGMIQFCLDNGFNPVLVVTPVSEAMNKCLSNNFIKKVLFDNIQISNVQGVPFYNYLRDERFQEIKLYSNNADFLNAKGRLFFSEVLLADTNTF